MNPVDFRILQGVMTKNFKKKEQENKERLMLKQEKSLLKNMVRGIHSVRSLSKDRGSPLNSNESWQKINLKQ